MAVDWNQVLGDVLTQVLRIVLPVCVALIFKWAIELYLKIKAEQPDIVPILDYVVEQAVLCAEMIYGSGHGEEKKDMAKKQVVKWLEEIGLSIDVDIISEAIEAEVYKQFHQYTAIEIPTDQAVTVYESAESEAEE